MFDQFFHNAILPKSLTSFFDVRWITWIRTCIFSGSLSILVNGCPSKEISIQKGLN